MKNILAITPKENAVETYRTFRPLKHSGHNITFIDRLTDNKKRQKLYKIAENLWAKGQIWFIKYIPNNNLLNVLCSAKQYLAEHGKKVTLVVDQDDNVFELPWGNLAMFYWQRERLEKQASLIATADWVVCSTNPLASYLKRFNENIIVIPNMIDPTEWRVNRKRKKNKKVKIGWVFSQTHVPDMPVIIEAVKDILEEFKDTVEFELLGGEDNLFPFKYKVNKVVPFHEYPKKLEQLNWDISIGPLADNKFNGCKSNIKWMESSLAGAVFIGSKVYPYEHSIEDGKTGFVCGSVNQWKNALRKLITNEKLRHEMVENARDVIFKKYNIKTCSNVISNFYEKI